MAGQLSSVTYAFGTSDQAPVLYTFDMDGRGKTETDGRGNVHYLNCDDARRLTSVVDALGKPTTYGYDADNRRASVVNAGCAVLNAALARYQSRMTAA
jgi:YD repeat-containing protein